jgi:hypothetical protein
MRFTIPFKERDHDRRCSSGGCEGFFERQGYLDGC